MEYDGVPCQKIETSYFVRVFTLADEGPTALERDPRGVLNALVRTERFEFPECEPLEFFETPKLPRRW